VMVDTIMVHLVGCPYLEPLFGAADFNVSNATQGPLRMKPYHYTSTHTAASNLACGYTYVGCPA